MDEDFQLISWLAHHCYNIKGLAKELGVSPNTVAVWCDRGAPNAAMLACYALAASIPPALADGSVQSDVQDWYASHGWDDRAIAGALGLPIRSSRLWGNAAAKVPRYLVLALSYLLDGSKPAQIMTPRAISGEQLREWRESRDLSVTVLAAALGYRQPTVFKWEKGTQPIPRLLSLALATLATEVEAGVWPRNTKYGAKRGKTVD